MTDIHEKGFPLYLHLLCLTGKVPGPKQLVFDLLCAVVLCAHARTRVCVRESKREGEKEKTI